MNKYVEYIEELLYLYDCVIVPGFGGFVGVYAGAAIDEKQGRILPPRKTVVFNRHLQQNDGLLIEWIARKETIPYEKAERRVTLFREELRARYNAAGIRFAYPAVSNYIGASVRQAARQPQSDGMEKREQPSSNEIKK